MQYFCFGYKPSLPELCTGARDSSELDVQAFMLALDVTVTHLECLFALEPIYTIKHHNILKTLHGALLA